MRRKVEWSQALNSEVPCVAGAAHVAPAAQYVSVPVEVWEQLLLSMRETRDMVERLVAHLQQEQEHEAMPANALRHWRGMRQ